MPALGALDVRLEIYRVAGTDDGAGGLVRSDVKIATVWANVRPASSSEVFRAQRNEQRITDTIVVRYNPRIAIAEGCRARYRDADRRVHDLRIRTVLDEGARAGERRKWLTISAEEGGPV